MLLQLSRHCHEFSLQPDYQSAYRENYSCETIILSISDNILWSMEMQRITSLVTIDLSAAFDTVDHDVLLNILKCKFGIEHNALKWFDNYLRPHRFKVIIEDMHSKERDLTVSVPQGSCAGAAIFNLYCAPLEDVIPKDLQISGFADDHSVRTSFHANNRTAELATKETMESCMLNIKQWMDTARLKMNPSKTEFIYFSHRAQLSKCAVDSITVAGDLILRSNIVCYLRVWMDKQLSFKDHITKNCKAVILSFTRIHSIRHLLMKEATESLVLSLCISHLDYCNAVLYGLPKSSLN